METTLNSGLVFLEFIEPKKRIIRMQNKVRIYKSGGLHFSKSITEMIKNITGQDAEKLDKLSIPALMALDKGEPVKKTIYIAFEKDGRYKITFTKVTKNKNGEITGSFRTSAVEITSRIPFNGKNSLSGIVEPWKQNTLQGLKITIE